MEPGKVKKESKNHWQQISRLPIEIYFLEIFNGITKINI